MHYRELFRLMSMWKFIPVSLCHLLLLRNAPSFPVLLFHPLPLEPQRQVILRPGPQLETLGAPALIWPHQPLVRTQSSPASTSLPHPPTTIPSLPLSSLAADVQLRFTTGEGHFIHQENVKRSHESQYPVTCFSYNSCTIGTTEEGK